MVVALSLCGGVVVTLLCRYRVVSSLVVPAYEGGRQPWGYGHTHSGACVQFPSAHATYMTWAPSLLLCARCTMVPVHGMCVHHPGHTGFCIQGVSEGAMAMVWWGTHQGAMPHMWHGCCPMFPLFTVLGTPFLIGIIQGGAVVTWLSGLHGDGVYSQFSPMPCMWHGRCRLLFAILGVS